MTKIYVIREYEYTKTISWSGMESRVFEGGYFTNIESAHKFIEKNWHSWVKKSETEYYIDHDNSLEIEEWVCLDDR